MIIRINYSLRVIEEYYKNIDFIDTKEYEKEKVLQCCRGEIESYGGLYSENALWRFVADIPFLKSNFDFCGVDKNMFKIAIPGNIDYYINNQIGNFNDDRYTHQFLSRFTPNTFTKFGFDDSKKSAIAQIKNNKVILVYPSINLIPSNIYDIDTINLLLMKRGRMCVVECNGYRWIKYSNLIKLVDNSFLHQNILIGNLFS